jgi:tetratricopeptide (TPR) repeat protein
VDQPEPSSEKRLRHWVRTLRPLLWWAAFVLMLLAIHTHLQWIERTRLEFSVNLEGKPLPFEASATLDGRPITSGDRLSLGSHTFALRHSKVEPFSTNLFIWYGLKNLGMIPLKRATGLLAVEVNPPARLVSVTGPEFSLTLTNSAGMTSSVPTDEYVIVARYLHSEERDKMAVASGSPNSRRMAPRLGTLVLECNRPLASFEVRASDGRLLETGLFPTSVSEVPEGVYNVVSQHHRNRDERQVTIMGGRTNVARVDFVYGTAILETDPPGARVTNSEGMDYGETPITLAELRPGQRSFKLQKAGFEPLQLLLIIAAEGTNSVRTNLLSLNYTSSMAAAREFIATGDYSRGLQAANDALNSKPGDVAAEELIAKAGPFVRLSRAQILGQQGDYTAAMRELELVLKALPADERAQALMGEYKTRQKEEAEKAHQARQMLVRKAFAQILSRHNDSELFVEHDIKTEKKASTVSGAILRALREQAPTFTIGSNTTPEPDVTAIVAKQESGGAGRICVIVIGQTAIDETEIRYELLEYKVQSPIPFVGALLNMPVEKNYIPLHATRVGQMTDKMRAQIDEGVKSMTERIMSAIGQ